MYEDEEDLLEEALRLMEEDLYEIDEELLDLE